MPVKPSTLTARSIRELRDQFTMEQIIAAFLDGSLDPIDAQAFSPEQAADMLRRREQLAAHTGDPDILAHAAEAALDQADLAALLDHQLKTIWLCGGPFSIPIRKRGVRYIGVGTPSVEGPFTEERYRKAGITFQGCCFRKKATRKWRTRRSRPQRPTSTSYPGKSAVWPVVWPRHMPIWSLHALLF